MISGVLCILLVFWCFWLFSCGLCPFVVLFYCHLLLAVVKKPGWGEPTYVFINNFQFFEEWIEEWLKKNKFGRTGLEGGLNGSNMSCLCNNDAELVGHLCFSLWEAMLALLCIQESGPLSSLNVCLQWSDNNMGHFKTLPMFAAWWIWKVRNLFIFEGFVRQPHLHSWLSSLNFFFLWTICRLLIQRSLRLKTGPFQYPPIPLSDNVGLLWSSLTGLGGTSPASGNITFWIWLKCWTGFQYKSWTLCLWGHNIQLIDFQHIYRVGSRISPIKLSQWLWGIPNLRKEREHRFSVNGKSAF